MKKPAKPKPKRRATKAARAQENRHPSPAGSPTALAFAAGDPRIGVPARAAASMTGTGVAAPAGDRQSALTSDAIGTRPDETPGMR